MIVKIKRNYVLLVRRGSRRIGHYCRCKMNYLKTCTS